MVFIANPNNPTGTYITIKEIKYLRKKLNNKILLVIDDAYFEYMKNKDYQNGLNLFKNSKNVFILRTFFKNIRPCFNEGRLGLWTKKYN